MTMIRGPTGMKMATIIAMMTIKPPNTNGGPGTVSYEHSTHLYHSIYIVLP